MQNLHLPLLALAAFIRCNNNHLTFILGIQDGSVLYSGYGKQMIRCRISSLTSAIRLSFLQLSFLLG